MERVQALKGRLYRTARLYLAGDAAALDAVDEAVVALRYFAGYTLAETAEILGIPPGTVSTRQRRALALLRLELSEEEGGQV